MSYCLQKWLLLRTKRVRNLIRTSRHSLSAFSRGNPVPPITYSVVSPGNVTPMIKIPEDVPDGIQIPHYARNAEDKGHVESGPEILSASDIDKVRKACQIAKVVLEQIAKLIAPGLTFWGLFLNALE